MRKLFWLAFVLVTFVMLNTPASAQSDCGNCYVAGHSCTVTADCGELALACVDIVHCDYDPCSYVVGPYCCAYPCSGLADNQPKESHAKDILARIRRRNAERTKGV